MNKATLGAFPTTVHFPSLRGVAPRIRSFIPSPLRGLPHAASQLSTHPWERHLQRLLFCSCATPASHPPTRPRSQWERSALLHASAKDSFPPRSPSRHTSAHNKRRSADHSPPDTCLAGRFACPRQSAGPLKTRRTILQFSFFVCARRSERPLGFNVFRGWPDGLAVAD